jgi:hypothetical protein
MISLLIHYKAPSALLRLEEDGPFLGDAPTGPPPPPSLILLSLPDEGTPKNDFNSLVVLFKESLRLKDANLLFNELVLSNEEDDEDEEG